MSPLEMYAAFSATFMTPVALVTSAQVLVDHSRWPEGTVTAAYWIGALAWIAGFAYIFAAT